MNAEHLLDAIGLLDDGLIREAEEYSKPKPRRSYGTWLSLAASFAVVLTLGYALTHLGMGGGGAAPEDQASGGAASAPAGSYGEPQAPDSANGAMPEDPDASFTPQGADTSETEYYVVRICVTDGNTQYAYDCRFDGVTASGPQVEAPQIETLPEGCRSLGRLRRMRTEEDFKLPHTDSGWYIGCPLWIQGEGWEGPVYLELPQGGYLVFEYSQTYDLSP